ncbi:hypothetical protein [Alkalihalophilus marmarensis]|uniref:Uncharacterized protein n=1 Tax=Alkalihalophilus marmarensis DSM 21297 TaxID=1188261 RepID=U6SRN2_9BACI|nr:hypothetical protein [Alkalihalophilus marmarensis]ERN54339.1 hypothetical protein A33I_07940 [Alkalihalophilus marmarensis DSM 21297]
MRAFSEVNLIKKEIENQRSVIWRVLTSSTVSVKLFLQNELLFRAKNLCEDVADLTEEHYKLDDLVQFLLEDIVDYVKRKQNIKYMHSLFLKFDKSTHNVRLKHYKNLSDEIKPLYPMNREKVVDWSKIRLRIERKDVLRLEVLLADMSKVYADHHFTVERVLEILLIDFVSKYEKGEATKILRKK